MPDPPFVSVVTPYHNTAPYIAQCIESVLAQSHTHFEYWLVNNKSTDGSGDIAARYAARDPRLKLADTTVFLEQIPNFNAALKRISPASKYVKMVLADDVVTPDCIAKLLAVAEENPRVGLVASYCIYEGRVDGAGLPYDQSSVCGTDALRVTLTAGRFLVGSPSTLLYRADLVRARDPFFTPGLYHADTEAAYDLLLEHDLGFVHQVLTFLRSDNESISSAVRDLYPKALDFLIAVERFGPQVLSPEEFAVVRDGAAREYFALLGRMLPRFMGRRFWDYHRGGIATLGRQLRWRDVLPWTLAELLHVLLNPENTIRRILGRRRRRRADRLARKAYAQLRPSSNEKA